MAYGENVVQRDLSFPVRRGEIFVLMGDSGCGKSTLMRHMIGLKAPAAGDVLYDGESFWSSGATAREGLKRKFGVLFQNAALFSSMTLEENVSLPLLEQGGLRPAEAAEVAHFKLALMGLAGFENHYPAEISGGMRKRAGLARALALDPEIVFLDEPTAGLDPIAASRFDQLIGELGHALGLTVVMVTHDLDTLHAICERVAVLVDKNIKVGPIAELRQAPHPWIQEYFGGPRGRAVLDAAE